MIDISMAVVTEDNPTVIEFVLAQLVRRRSDLSWEWSTQLKPAAGLASLC